VPLRARACPATVRERVAETKKIPLGLRIAASLDSAFPPIFGAFGLEARETCVVR